MPNSISFVHNFQPVTINFEQQTKLSPTTTVLQYLRKQDSFKGTKEGCAEGDCGACTVVISELVDGNIKYTAVNSCLIFLPKLHGKHLITVEGLASPDGKLHLVQQAMVDFYGSQCGYCTPGFVMSLFALYKNSRQFERADAEDALTGNLCRCTGYQPIIKAAEYALSNKMKDRFDEQEDALKKMLQFIPNVSLKLKTQRQYYHLPATQNDLLNLKQNYPEALLISGSTDVALRVTKKHDVLEAIIDVSNINELKEIKQSGDNWFIGSGVSINQLLEFSKDRFPAIFNMCVVFGSRQIRELATLGGNLGTASPIGDFLPLLFAYNAVIIVQSAKEIRRIGVQSFIKGYRQTALTESEIILGIELPEADENVLVRSYKISKRKDLDISTVSAAFRIVRNEQNAVTDCMLAFGGMAEVTRRALKTESFLTGKKWTRELVEQAQTILQQEFTPISDARSGEDFRRIAAGNLLLKFWIGTS